MWEREILRRSGPSERRRPATAGGDRPDGLPLLREVFPERPLSEFWEVDVSPSQPVIRAAAARLEAAGLVSLLAPTAREATLWIDEQVVDLDDEQERLLRRRLLQTSFSWRTLLGDELVAAYTAVFGRPASESRMRWDTRLDAAHVRADQRCREAHREADLQAWRRALTNPKRLAAPARR